MATTTRLKGVENFGDSLVSTQIETNVSAFLNWGLLGIGAFSNVNIPTSGVYGGRPYQLTKVSDPYFQDGQVWQGFRQDWVWESSIDYAYQPIAISGVYVDGNFKPNNTTGTYAFHIDYPQGRVVFDSPITAVSGVTCEYSYRNVRVATADAEWFQELQFNSFRADDPQFGQTGSGAWNVLARNRIQLPCVVIEPVFRVRQFPLEVGSFTLIHQQDFLFHVITETPWERKQLHDILVNQYEHRISSFDKDLLLQANKYPLMWDGSLNPSGVFQYPDLVTKDSPLFVESGSSEGFVGEDGKFIDLENGSFFWRQIRFIDMKSQEVETPLPLFRAQVRATLETDMP